MQRHNNELLIPEPVYTIRGRDTKDDALVLFINPRNVSTKLNLNDWNKNVKTIHTKWDQNDYLNEKIGLKILDPKKGSHWRDVRKRQVEGIIGPIGFMHTMEFFPYHTDKWAIRKKETIKWLHENRLTQMMLDAIHDASTNQRFKFIAAVGNMWRDSLLQSTHFQMVGEAKPFKTNGRTVHTVYKFITTPHSTPIIVYVTQRRIGLPRDLRVVEAIREMIQ